MPKDVILTPEGLASLKAELETLSTVRRREVAARIKEAREFGDISENAEYDDAKNEQAMLEARIAQLEDRLRSATVIDASDLGTDVVRVGSKVHVKDGDGKSATYTIVGSAEAAPAERKALQRVAGRQGAGRPQVGRRGVDHDAPRRAAPEDHQDRSRVARHLAMGEEPPEAGGADGSGDVLGDRRRKLERLRAAGVDPFPHEFGGVEPIAAVRAQHTDSSQAPRRPSPTALPAGSPPVEVRAKMAFLDLVDRSGRIQLQARVDELGCRSVGGVAGPRSR